MVIVSEMLVTTTKDEEKRVPCAIDITDIQAMRQSADDESQTVVLFRSGDEWRVFSDFYNLLGKMRA